MPVSRKTVQSHTWPPIPPRDNETADERKSRRMEEAEAKRASDVIDRQLEQERQQNSRIFAAKILLLGQAESGKSTILKNFQLYFAPKTFETEAEVWRPIIHLNLVRSVNFIVNFISSPSHLRDSSTKHSRSSPSPSPTLSQELRKLCIRLGPLLQVEENLNNILSCQPAAKYDNQDSHQPQPAYNPAKAPEISIPSNTGWKQTLSLHLDRTAGNASESEKIRRRRLEVGQNMRILAALGGDIATLWQDADVRQILKAAGVALEEQPGFFLDQAHRITRDGYIPRPDDVLKARVATTGPEEHTIMAEDPRDGARKWTIYDVGGSRGQRATWAQFFDNVNIIIFLAPMSGFNQALVEDESVNRLTDSLRLWQMICSNKILASVQLVLLLNKLDILDTKLKSGIDFASFVSSYGKKQPNETKPVAKHLLDLFTSLHQQHSPARRQMHSHLTCAVDTKATSAIIGRIQEVILVKNLTKAIIL